MQNGLAVCQCPQCYTADPYTGACDVLIDSCECNNPCVSVDTCQDLPSGNTQCVCDCIGNEECVTDRDTNQQSCKCPLCYTNKPGESGCLTGMSITITIVETSVLGYQVIFRNGACQRSPPSHRHFFYECRGSTYFITSETSILSVVSCDTPL